MATQTDYRPAPPAHLDERRPGPGRDFNDAVWAARVRRALHDQRLELSPQPMMPLTGGAVRDKLLLRMIECGGERVAAEAFLPAAEKFGLVTCLDGWTIAKAVRFAAVGQIVHVRLSAASVRGRFMTDQIAHELCAAGAPAAHIHVEVPADALMSCADGGHAFAAGLHALGCGLTLHGVTCDTSAAQLEQLRVDALTIDRHVVGSLLHSPRHRRWARAIVSLSRDLDVQLIADGVDERETLALLREWGVDYAHGALIDRPAVPNR
jgi:EAL domain-containing protein (putative c-di-GMP-specific phosphodiesterase class I)